jgi:N-acetylglucosaminyldiphosphoundecaprenol N-acetyl-beta-D-mannosaminyltransferase
MPVPTTGLSTTNSNTTSTNTTSTNTAFDMRATPISTQSVIGFPVCTMSFEHQVAAILEWAKAGLSKVVCVANVHMLVEASSDRGLANILEEADLVTPDGMPLVWMVQWMRKQQQDRVAGMDLMLAVCQAAIAQNVSVYFLGSDAKTLEQIRQRLKRELPHLKVAGMSPLPMLSTPIQVDSAVVEQVNSSGAGIVFLSLGCPKQEKWMAAYRDRTQAVMLGIGGVFPIYAGQQQRAPEFIRDAGFEWLYRLVQEPKRLWSRYSRTIPPFLWMAAKQLMLHRHVKTPALPRSQAHLVATASQDNGPLA